MANKNKKSGINSIIAAAAGAVVGASVTVAGTIALKDKKNREKVKRAINDVKKQVNGKKYEVKINFDEGLEKVKRIIKSVKKEANFKKNKKGGEKV